jgi:hypothetical protein
MRWQVVRGLKHSGLHLVLTGGKMGLIQWVDFQVPLKIPRMLLTCGPLTGVAPLFR